MSYTLRPIERWPRPFTEPRRKSAFSASWATTERDLDDELRALDAEDVVLQLAFKQDGIRLGGSGGFHLAPEHPGVVLSFRSKHGPLAFYCDTYLTWQENVRAIYRTLSTLRAVDRHGVVQTGEQYRGWAALPEGKTRPSLRRARELLLERGGFRAAAMETHPDRGGDRETFEQIVAAKEVLEAAGEPVP